MLNPVGSLPPRVYWRRRVLLAGVVLAALLLAVLTLHALGSGSGDKKADAAAGPSQRATGVSSSADATASSPTPVTSTPVTATTAPVTSLSAGSATASVVVAAAPCASSQLKIAALTSAAAYRVGAQPVLSLVVTNTATAPCVQNLADSQIELRVYNGAARVWGSHDCKIEPGADLETLPAGKAIQRDVTWSGFSSQPLCAGTRTRVGAGTYTLYVLLSGIQGSLAKFTIN
jgi:hypothetical protein